MAGVFFAAGLVALVLVCAGLVVAGHRRRVRLARIVARLRTQVDAGGEPDAFVEDELDGLAQVVDRLAARDRELARDRRALERALDAIPQGVVLADSDGTVTHRNVGAASYATARHGEALVEAAIVEVLEEAAIGIPAHRNLELFGPPRRTLVVTSVPLDTDAAVKGSAAAMAIIDDVTERRRLEAIRRDFVANISHELKTPVGAIALLAETLLEEDDEAVRERLAERMLLEADRVGRTIEDLLTLSQIESEEGPEREGVPAHLVIAEATERIRPAADHRDIEVRAEEPSARLTILGDRRQLVSALYNLLDNAVKYSDHHSVVEVRARTDGRSIDLQVEDHGIGIPSADLERIFERFYRVDQARSRQTGGTGLGLAIVRHVATNHDGEIRVDSRAGEGSTFTLRLPAASGPVVVTAEAG